MFSRKRSSPQKNHLFRWVAASIGVILLFDLVTFLIAEGLWFEEIDFFQVFRTRIQVQGLLGLLAFGCSLALLFSNLALARQHRWTKPPIDLQPLERNRAEQRRSLPGHMGIVRLVLIAFGFSFILGAMLIYHGQVAASHWHPNLSLYSHPQVPVKFQLGAIWQFGRELTGAGLWQIGLALVLAIALLLYHQPLLAATGVVMSLGFGLVLSEHWAEFLLYFSAAPFNRVDPLFERDISFYIFKLPVWELVDFWLTGLFSLVFITVSLVYLLSGDSLSQGRFPGFSPAQQRHLFGLGGALMLAIALSYWLDRYELLYSTKGVTYGASYTNATIQLPAYTLLSLGSLVLAGVLFWRSLFWQEARLTRPDTPVPPKPSIQSPKSQILKRYSSQNSTQSSAATSPTSRAGKSSFPQERIPAVRPHLWSVKNRPLIYGIGAYGLLILIGNLLLPATVQSLVVQPNELDLERPYIERTIALSREAFNLDAINDETFDPQGNLTFEDIQENDLTINNIRLWDTRPLLETNRQLQRIRLYYEFPDADIDRYTLQAEDGTGTILQQVLIAARELDYDSVPPEAQTWVNKHLIYTHGYGFTLSPVNTAGEGGLPDYYIRGIEQIPSSPRIRDSIPLGQPRIYFGEMTNTYVMTQTDVRELDYPSGSENIYNTYDGRGGVPIGSLWRRLVFAKHMRDWRMLLTDNFTRRTKLLFRRNIRRRVQAIAPFLRYDNDPYLVVANVPGQTDENYLHWIIDAYTTSDRYPYSDPQDNDFNYIRNSVKVVVDAFHGSIRFYVADPTDPIITTWSRVFPGMFLPLDDMPPTLRSHIRYPQDYYQVQSQELMTYHMTDPQVFYNREDQWRAPSEIYAAEQQLVKPYYLIMRLPTATSEEFILLRPFTPVQRNNLIAWLAARSDQENYGRMLLYTFPKQELVYGPEQIEARINQDPVISQQISLWNRQGSRAVQGNLLVIPIEQSLLYVEPLYLEAEQNQLPILARVIVAYENRIVMAETLTQAIEAVFQERAETTAPAIIRSVGEDLVPALEGVSP